MSPARFRAHLTDIVADVQTQITETRIWSNNVGMPSFYWIYFLRIMYYFAISLCTQVVLYITCGLPFYYTMPWLAAAQQSNMTSWHVASLSLSLCHKISLLPLLRHKFTASIFLEVSTSASEFFFCFPWSKRVRKETKRREASEGVWCSTRYAWVLLH